MEQMEEYGVMANLDSYISYFFEKTASLFQLLSQEETVFFLDEPLRVKEHADAIEMEFVDSMKTRLEKGIFTSGTEQHHVWCKGNLCTVAKTVSGVYFDTGYQNAG